MPRQRKPGLLEHLAIDHQMLNLIAGLDEFKGRWEGLSRELSPAQLAELGNRATVESVGSSTRMDGVRMTDGDIDRFLFGADPGLPSTRDERAVAGYAEALEMVYDAVRSETLGTGFIRRLHGALMWYSDAGADRRGEYRSQAVEVQAYDAGGRPSGPIFEAPPPQRLGALMEDLVRWTRRALDSGEYHPLLVTASFMVYFLVAHPFGEGSGRLSRLLATWMLMRCGYVHVPYGSLERVLEETRGRYHRTLGRAARHLMSEDSDPGEWMVFFLRALAGQRDELVRRVERLMRLSRIPELSVRLLDLARRSTRLTMADAVDSTGANRNTIKVHLRQLVKQGRLVRHGSGRGTWYTIG